ncbi:substrate-binding periplasmic protein [Ottowia sp. VDI28]|uniref:substrate-binding periplasmic protein n=1 Tax=Ottowia sp. VDI28 TaxID=3133968 RepID=UPI003C30B9FA
MSRHTLQLKRRQVLFGLLPLWPAAHAQAELADLDRVRARGTLKVALYKDNAPFSGNVPGGGMQGLDVAIAAALAREMGLQLALLPFDADENMNDDLRNMVWRGHYLGYGPADVMLHVPVDKYLMQENRQALIFAPYMREQVVLAHDVRRVPEVRAAEDLKGLPLAVERGTGAASALMGHGGGLLRADVHLYPSGPEAVKAVLEGKAAAAYVTRAQAESVLSKAEPKPGDIRLTPLQLRGVPDGWPIGLAIKAENRKLGEALETALQSLRSKGELLAIFQQQGLTLTAP